MARRLIGGVLAMVLGACAWPAAAQPAPAPAPATAGDAAPSDAKLALAHQVVEATGVEAALSASFHDMVKVRPTRLPQAREHGREAQARRKVFAEAQADAMAGITPKIVASLVDSYARDYTTRELSDVLAFYQSPSGRSMVAKTPQLMRRVTTNLIGLVPQIRHDMGEEACAKIACTAAERTAFGLAPATH